MGFLLRILAVAAVIFVLRSLADPSWGQAFSALLISAALGLAAVRSCAAGPELVVVLAGLYFVPGSLINLTEAALFNVVAVGDVPGALAHDLLVALFTGTIITALSGRLHPSAEPLRPPAPNFGVPGFLWRLVAVSFVFVLCYFLAGMAIYPFVRDYYEVRQMPALAAMASMQVLRSLALLAIAYPLLRTIPSRRDARLVLSVALPAIGGIAPLIPANSVMPVVVRFVHALEITPYYALYGFLIATWFGAPRGSLSGPASPAEQRETGTAGPGP